MQYLLAVDGSDQSLDATRAFEALTPAESLKVLHVVSVPGIPYPAMGANVAKDLAMTVERAMKEEGERVLDQAESLLPLHSGAVSKQLEMGSPAESILKVAQEEKVDLVVMGARGLGRIREQIFGSVSHRVMTHAPCSTFLVKQSVRSIKNLLVPIDGQEDADAVLSFFKKSFSRAVLDHGLSCHSHGPTDVAGGGNDFARIPQRDDGLCGKVYQGLVPRAGTVGASSQRLGH